MRKPNTKRLTIDIRTCWIWFIASYPVGLAFASLLYNDSVPSRGSFLLLLAGVACVLVGFGLFAYYKKYPEHALLMPITESANSAVISAIVWGSLMMGLASWSLMF
jgi:hypothetical protein